MAKRSVKTQVPEPPKENPSDHKTDDVPRLPPPPQGGYQLPVSVLWPKGVSGNPGGAPKGKRISTWLAEYGDMDLSDDEIRDKLARPGLTRNARAALAQLLRAGDPVDGLPAAAWAADRVEGGVDRTVHLTHKQEPTMSLEDAAKVIEQAKLGGPAPKADEW